MQEIQLNGQTTKLVVVGPDGMEVNVPLSAREKATLEALDLALRNNPRFRLAHPGAHLVRVDSMRSLEETEEGRYYLCYATNHGFAELWGHVSKNPHIDVQSGLVSVAPPALRSTAA